MTGLLYFEKKYADSSRLFSRFVLCDRRNVVTLGDLHIGGTGFCWDGDLVLE